MITATRPLRVSDLTVGKTAVGPDLCQEQVFDGQDAYGARRALPWQPDPVQADAKPDLTVRFQAQERPPYQFNSVQRAVDFAVRQGQDTDTPARVVIDIGPGFFEGPVIIPAGAPPMVLRGAGAEATILAAPIDARMSGMEYAARFKETIAPAGALSKAMFAQITARSHIGTGNTAVLRVASNDVEILGLTIRNDYACDRPDAAPPSEVPDAEGRFARGQHQAVAVMLDRVDRIILRDCVLISFQDTLYLRGAPDTVLRAALERCHIAGDVDFIFGGATAFFDRCTLQSRGLRGAQSWVLAPSTSLHQAFGFVLQDCAFTHDAAPAGQKGGSFLGRQWFEGVRATPYGTPTLQGYACRLGDVNRFDPPQGTITRTTLEAVGKAIVTRSTLGPHLCADRLWDDWASGPWSPRFRPVQGGGADFLRALADWLPQNAGDYDRICDQRWLHI